MCNEPLLGRHWRACISRNHGRCCRVMTASSGSMMRLSPLNRSATPPTWRQQFMRSLHFSLLLQRAPLEAMLHAAGLSVLAWVVLSERYHVHTRPDEECDRLLHAYHLDGVHQGYIGGMLLEKFYNRGWVDYVLLVLTLHRAASR